MITVSIDPQSSFLVKVPVMAGKVRDSLRKAVYTLAVELQAYIVTQKLSGDPLNKITGHLQQSIQHVESESATDITAKVYSAGDVKYAAIHEYGGVINHPGGTAFFITAGGLAQFVSNEVAFQYGNFPRTKPHQIHMPERSFMRSSLRENKDHIVETLRKAVIGGIEQ